MANEKTAFDPSDRAAEIARRAQLPRDLFGGTEAMRARGIEYLPKWPLEPADAWAARKNSTFLSPGYKQAVQTAVGKAFGDSIVLHEDVPLEIRGSEVDDNGPAIEGLWENIDNTGNHGDTFAQFVFSDSLHVGIGHILVDYPVLDNVETLAEERDSGARPYWVYVPGDAVLGWRTEQVNGRTRLSMFRFLETTTEAEGEFGEATVTRARVYYAGSVLGDGNSFARFEVYRKDNEGKVQLEREGPLFPHVEIPVATFYARRTGHMTGAPFFEDLAFTCLEEWQSGSEQRNHLHFARVPFYHFAGFSEDEYKAVTAIGSNARVYSRESSARVNVVEGNGNAMEQGWKDLDRLKAEIKSASMEPLVSGLVAETAMGRAIDEARAHSALEAAMRNFEDCIEDALGKTAVWLGLDYDQGGSVSMTERLSPLADESTKFEQAIKLYQQRAISKRKLLERAKAFHVLDEDADIEEVLEEVDAEGADGFAVPSFGADDRTDETNATESGAVVERNREEAA